MIDETGQKLDPNSNPNREQNLQEAVSSRISEWRSVAIQMAPEYVVETVFENQEILNITDTKELDIAVSAILDKMQSSDQGVKVDINSANRFDFAGILSPEDPGQDYNQGLLQNALVGVRKEVTVMIMELALARTPMQERIKPQELSPNKLTQFFRKLFLSREDKRRNQEELQRQEKEKKEIEEEIRKLFAEASAVFSNKEHNATDNLKTQKNILIALMRINFFSRASVLMQRIAALAPNSITQEQMLKGIWDAAIVVTKPNQTTQGQVSPEL